LVVVEGQSFVAAVANRAVFASRSTVTALVRRCNGEGLGALTITAGRRAIRTPMPGRAPQSLP
ncbi:MAG TPA: hypothetical protein VIU62_15190, partial [Chloroflexota bacterium]